MVMTEQQLPRSANQALRKIIEEVLGNTLEIGDEVIGGQFSEKQLDTGGIEPDAYYGALLFDWQEAVKTMGLSADTDTYRRYLYICHLKLFGLRRDKDGYLVTAEKRIPPRLTPDENLELIPLVTRDMEKVRRGDATLHSDGKISPIVAPNARVASPSPVGIYGPSNSYLEPSLEPKVRNKTIGDADDEDIDPRSRPKRPSDVFGVPEASPTKQRRPMRPDDHFGTPETRGDLISAEPERVSVLRAASAPRSTTPSAHAYSMSIRPGETRTQRIELPGLTLDQVITMPG